MWVSHVVVKNPPANSEDTRDLSSIPGSGNGKPLQHSCLKSPTDRGAWRAPAHKVAESQTWLSTTSITVSRVPLQERMNWCQNTEENNRWTSAGLIRTKCKARRRKIDGLKEKRRTDKVCGVWHHTNLDSCLCSWLCDLHTGYLISLHLSLLSCIKQA